MNKKTIADSLIKTEQKPPLKRMTAHEKLIIRSIQSYYFTLSQHTYSIVCISYYTIYRYVAAIENKEARYI